MPRPAAAETMVCRSIIQFIRITIPHLDSTRSEYVGSTRLPQGQKNSKLRQLVRGGLNGQNRVLGYRSLSPAFYPGGVWPGSRKQLITTIYQWYWSHLTGVPFRFDGAGGWPSANSDVCLAGQM
jgi:hypothetical protein